MKVSELIASLQTMPPDANVTHLWDGEPRTHINHVWLARSGEVVTAGDGETCYSTEGRPVSAPDNVTERYWKTPDNRPLPSWML